MTNSVRIGCGQPRAAAMNRAQPLAPAARGRPAYPDLLQQRPSVPLVAGWGIRDTPAGRPPQPTTWPRGRAELGPDEVPATRPWPVGRSTAGAWAPSASPSLSSTSRRVFESSSLGRSAHIPSRRGYLRVSSVIAVVPYAYAMVTLRSRTLADRACHGALGSALALFCRKGRCPRAHSVARYLLPQSLPRPGFLSLAAPDSLPRK